MVMHRKLPRLNDGYQHHQHQPHNYQSSKYSSKRDYESSSRSASYVRNDRETSLSGMNGNYRSVSPDIDSPPRDRHGDRYQSSSYVKVSREKDHRDYKKDKYSDKRGSGRDRELEYRNSHDSRRSRVSCKRDGSSSNSDDRDKVKEYEKAKEYEKSKEYEKDCRYERGGGSSSNAASSSDKITRVGDWSEHVSSSAKKYYYNCKTEVSQWEKPREWQEKERTMSKDFHHRDYRDKEREKESSYVSNRGSYAGNKHSRGSSRVRWHSDDAPPASHRRRHDENADMDISPDSTPTSEASYSHSSTPTANQQPHPKNSSQNDGPVLLANALPRLLSNSSAPTSSSSANNSNNSHYPSATATSTTASAPSASNPLISKLAGLGSSTSSSPHSQTHHQQPLTETSLNSNTPGPPNGNCSIATGMSGIAVNSTVSGGNSSIATSGGSTMTLAGLPKILSHITGNKTIDQNELNPQKALQTINNALMLSRQHPTSMLHDINVANINSNSLREHVMNSPLYGLHSLNHNSNVSTAPQASSFFTSSSSMSTARMDMSSDGPPTPEMDIIVVDPRKIEASSISSLHGVMTSSVAANRLLGPNLTPSLSNYYREDLIAHVVNWPAEIAEKQAQKCSEDAHVLGDLTCSKISTELKCARSVVRVTEIYATLQEQKIMYLRQQTRRLEELKSQNSFMSEDL